MSIGRRTKPQQQRPSAITIEVIAHDHARVQGIFDVVVPGSVWASRLAVGDLETEIEEAIRAVLVKHAKLSAETGG